MQSKMYRPNKSTRTFSSSQLLGFKKTNSQRNLRASAALTEIAPDANVCETGYPTERDVKKRVLRSFNIEKDVSPFQNYLFESKDAILKACTSINGRVSTFNCKGDHGFSYKVSIIAPKSVLSLEMESNDGWGTSRRTKRITANLDSEVSKACDIDLMIKHFGVMSLSNHENLCFLKQTIVWNDTLFVFSEIPVNFVMLSTVLEQNLANKALTAEEESIELDAKKSSDLWPWNEEVVSHMMKSLVSLLYYLHERKIVFRSLSAENIMLCPDGSFKISNFQDAVIMTNEKPIATGIKGNVAYLAPEVFTKQGYGCLSDIWSLGVLARELITGKLVKVRDAKSLEARTPLEAMFMASELSRELTDFDLGIKISQSLKSFLQCCLINYPRRWTASELNQHPVIRNSNASNIFRVFIQRRYFSDL